MASFPFISTPDRVRIITIVAVVDSTVCLRLLAGDSVSGEQTTQKFLAFREFAFFLLLFLSLTLLLLTTYRQQARTYQPEEVEEKEFTQRQAKRSSYLRTSTQSHSLIFERIFSSSSIPLKDISRLSSKFSSLFFDLKDRGCSRSCVSSVQIEEG